MKTLPVLWLTATVMSLTAGLYAQPALTEPPEFPASLPGPNARHPGFDCFLLAGGAIVPGDVDWVQVTIPGASIQAIVDVDFPGAGASSALLASVVDGGTGFNINDNNNARDGFCGLGASSDPVGSLSDSAVDLGALPARAVIHIGISGGEDTAFTGQHDQSFEYEVWVYVVPEPCTSDADCDDGVACTVDACDSLTSLCSYTPDNVLCDNGLFCDGVETCDAKDGCQAGTPPDCADGVDCTADSCDGGTDMCVNSPDDSLCDNGVFCDGAETCDVTNGCQPGTPPDCDDGVDCTTDSCDAATDMCVNSPDDGLCDNGVFCDGVETCDVTNGCQAGTPPDCGDGVDCTADSCDAATDMCVNWSDDDLCDNGVFCDGIETCDATEGCQPGMPPDCDDGVDCTVDRCDEPSDTCVNEPDDSFCDDGLFCNGSEICDRTADCLTGSDPCPGRFCLEDEGRCVDCLGDADCDDGAFCNGAETCNAAGECEAGAPPCPPGQVCNPDTQDCETASLTLDIRPGACPNKYTVSGHGVLPIALVGSVGFDPAMIDLATIRLSRADGVGSTVAPHEGPPGPHSVFNDVASPFAGDACDCHALEGDGITDLSMKFKGERLLAGLALDEVPDDTVLELVATGSLLDGTTFAATDCVTIHHPRGRSRGPGGGPSEGPNQKAADGADGSAEAARPDTLGCGAVSPVMILMTLAAASFMSSRRRPAISSR